MLEARGRGKEGRKGGTPHGWHLWHHRTRQELEGTERVRQETASSQVETVSEADEAPSQNGTCTFLEASFQGQSPLLHRAPSTSQIRAQSASSGPVR